MNEIPEYPICERFTLENFIVLKENKFAYKTALMAVEKPRRHNLIYISGSMLGLGVTHLLKAIALKVKNEKPGRKLRYVDFETFLSQYVDAKANRTSQTFHSAYTDEIDCLLFDATECLAKKREVQHEFCVILDELLDAGKQVVLGGHGGIPHETPGLTKEAASLLESVPLAEIEAPGYDSRLVLIGKFMEKCPRIVDHHVLELIAENISGNIRNLEAAFRTVNLYSQVKDEPISIEKAMEYLSELFERDKNNYLGK